MFDFNAEIFTSLLLPLCDRGSAPQLLHRRKQGHNNVIKCIKYIILYKDAILMLTRSINKHLSHLIECPVIVASDISIYQYEIDSQHDNTENKNAEYIPRKRNRPPRPNVSHSIYEGKNDCKKDQPRSSFCRIFPYETRQTETKPYKGA